MATSSHPMLYERLGGVYRIATVAAALTALFVVLYLEAKAGRIEFEAWQFKIRGVSGEVVLFVVVFLAIATAVKL